MSEMFFLRHSVVAELTTPGWKQVFNQFA